MTAPTAATARVLVVDDEPGMRETLVDILGAHGIITVTAGDAETARKLTADGDIALALVDHRLPDATGLELTDALHEIDPDLPVLLLTGFASADTAVAAVGRVEDFLVKPVPPERVVTAVRNGLDRRWLRVRNAELVAQLTQANEVLQDNVRRRQNELTALIAMATAVASTSRLPLVLDAAVDVLSRTSGASAAAVYLYDDGGSLLLRAVRAGSWSPPMRLPAVGERVTRVDIDGHPCVIATLSSDGVASGALLVARVEQEADAFLVALATQVAVGIENARRSERERATVERMAELNRMKSSFLANVSHELRTPLTAVIGFARTLRGRGASLGADERAMLLERIETQAKRLHRLVEDLLDEAHLDRGTLRVSNAPVRAADVVDRVLSSLPDPVHRFEVTMPADLPIVIADPGRLEQVLTNLVDNARKYAPVGSTIDIGAGVTHRGVELSVRDHGPGISAEFLPRLFEPFTQADIGDTRTEHGVGLGLSISKGLVEAMGGALEVVTETGSGTTFTVVMPRVVPAPKLPVGTVDAPR